MKRTSEVFGISNEILEDSYVDRANLDEEISNALQLPKHVAIRGESKCGKSWLRQKLLPEAIVVQCRLGKNVLDIYIDILSQLNINFVKFSGQKNDYSGTIEGSGDFGWSLIAKAKAKLEFNYTRTTESQSEKVGQDINDLRFIAEIIKQSKKRIVIEDFHYMSVAERKVFAYDLKAFWDYGVFVVIIGIWMQQNMLLYLNSDLTGRVYETSIYWSRDDLYKVASNGGGALNIEFSKRFLARLISDCYENVGIFQNLIQMSLFNSKVYTQQKALYVMDDLESLERACLEYAEQLNSVYQQFARNVSEGIKRRSDSTAIYAHAMAVITEQPDDKLLRGLHRDTIFQIAHEREQRIQSGNMHTILKKIENIQVDNDGRGLVVSYNEMTKEITVVDRQLLFYRKYSTVQWPWEDLIKDIVS